MSDSSPDNVTRLLENAGHGDSAAAARLLTLIYDELHGLAAGQMHHERGDHTLQATALVHEAYLRLVGETNAHWRNRAHFFGAAAAAMRRILVDHARGRRAQKRGGGRARLPLDELTDWNSNSLDEMIAIHEALTELEASDEQKSTIVKLRFFAGLTNEQIADALEISERTVKRQWHFAKVWLYRRVTSR